MNSLMVIRNILRVLLLVTVVINGIYSVLGMIHPYQYEVPSITFYPMLPILLALIYINNLIKKLNENSR
ncbi:hypothetical protein SAMN04488054_10834 [Salibacterium qingdaonense]|uniref:Uncharacterized protein n=2 Tax=Salibacterium TaxID=1884429 RepID=A0A1I4LLG7_9BACI|nr:hypothetical protein SAMN04488054_10834 [Salibacterium qingdaonense]SFP68515.1 hypothetical protein SAMN05518683_108134 [Salibacterium halotolerans]